MPPPPQRDRLKPLLGAGVCFLFLQVGFWFLSPLLQFLGGPMVALTVSIMLSAGISNALCMAIFESRSWMDLGLGWREGVGRNLMIGIALGSGAALLSVVPDVAVGLARFTATPDAAFSLSGSVVLLMLLFCGAVGEEFAFRGFVLQYLVRGYGKWVALIATGALFGLLHRNNPDATWLSVLNTALFGILFGYAVIRTHDLWLPIGLHFGWNATLPFLGVELSGLTIKVSGYQLVWKAGELWSGGKYGPEAGLTATTVLAILFVAIWKMPFARNSAWLLEAPAPESV